MSLRLLVLLAGCTVPSGTTPDAMPCAPSTSFFVSDVWLGYIDSNQCATASCHGGRGYLRYLPAGTMPDPMSSIDSWPQSWRSNYYQSIQLMRCDDPLQSRLLTVPEGKAEPHPPGISVELPAAAEDLFRRWIDAP